MERDDPRALWEANAPTWIELSRAGYDVCRDLVNTPAFLEMLPDVDGLRGLDLGCGEGHNTRLLAERGADMVALDVAPAFVRAGAEVERQHPVGIEYILGDAHVLPFPEASFDFVAAFMSLMDVADPERALREVVRVLHPGGFCQCSVLHPVASTPTRRWLRTESGEKEAFAFADYFHEGPVSESWIFSAAPEALREARRPFTITYARRTLAGWLNAFIAAGLVLEAVAEPHLDAETERRHPEVAGTSMAPLFLLVRARRA